MSLLVAAPCVLALLLAGDAYGFEVKTNAEKKEALLEMLEDYVPRAEARWCPEPNPPTVVPPAFCDDQNEGEQGDLAGRSSDGFFFAHGSGVFQERGGTAIAAAYATLLSAKPSQPSFGGVSRATMTEHVRQQLRHTAFSNDLYDDNSGDNGSNDEWWGGSECLATHCIAPNYAYQMAWAAQLMWSDLDSGTRAAVEDVVASEADIVMGWGPHTKSGGNSFAEENAQAVALLAAAAAFFPGSGDEAAWELAAKDFAFETSSRALDASDSTVLDGQPVSDWVDTVNLSNDYSIENHSFFHPVYSQGVFGADLGHAAVFYDEASQAIPQAFHFRLAEVWDSLLGKLAWEDGDIVMPAGTDWVTHDYQHISYLAYVATWEQRDDASVLESRAIDRLQARQDAYASGPLNGSLYGHPEIGYETDVLRTLAIAWWMHQDFQPSPAPTESQFNAARESSDGVTLFPDHRAVVGRMRDALVSMSWDDGGSNHRSVGLVVPSSRNHLDDPILMQYWTRSGVGAAGLGGGGGLAGSLKDGYGCDCDQDEFFSTAATMEDGTVDRNFSMTAFDDGTTVLLDRGVGETFDFAFESAPELIDDRPTFTEAGEEGVGSLTGEWVNEDNRFGLISKGGSGLGLEAFADIDPDPNISNPHIRLEGSQGTGSGNRGAIVLPLATAKQTALLAPEMDVSTISDSNWSATTGRALDGTNRIAVARWGGSASATVTMASPLGSPIPDRPNDVTVNAADQGSTVFALSDPASIGHKGYFWIETTNAVTVRPISETRAKITNGGSSSTVTTRYTSGDGVLHSAPGTLAANRIGFARAIDDGVAIVTPSGETNDAGHPADQVYDGSTTSTNYWSSTSQNLPANPQDVWLDFGKLVDMGGLTMTPHPGNGPRDYTLHTSTSSSCGDGSTGYGAAVATVDDASSSVATTTSFPATRARCVLLRASDGWAGSTSKVQVRELEIAPPTIDVDAVNPLVSHLSGSPRMRLARSGWNTATIRVRNNGGSSANVTIGTSSLGTGVSASASPASVSVPAGQFQDVQVNLTASGTTPTSGSDSFNVTGTNAAAEPIDALFTDNLALNDVGTALPSAGASSEDPGYLFSPALAIDGSTAGSSFWVSGPQTLGASTPECITIDLGNSINVGRVEMVPRTNYGPKDYKVQTRVSGSTSCASETGWTTRDTRNDVANGSTISSTWTPAAARYLRIRVTESYANGASPPHQTQVRELRAYPN